MSEIGDQLKERTMRFAIDVLRLVDRLPRTSSGYAVGKQLARSGTSIGANYRATRTSRSRDEFIAKLGIVVEEADESTFWLDVIVRSRMLDAAAVDPLRTEANALRAIFAKSVGTARANRRASRMSRRVPHDQMTT
jgi:four helix bundle protein